MWDTTHQLDTRVYIKMNRRELLKVAFLATPIAQSIFLGAAYGMPDTGLDLGAIDNPVLFTHEYVKRNNVYVIFPKQGKYLFQFTPHLHR